MKIIITIDTANAAFDDENRDAELARIFGSLADGEIIRHAINQYPERFKLRDINGNTCGSVMIRKR